MSGNVPKFHGWCNKTAPVSANIISFRMLKSIFRMLSKCSNTHH